MANFSFTLHAAKNLNVILVSRGRLKFMFGVAPFVPLYEEEWSRDHNSALIRNKGILEGIGDIQKGKGQVVHSSKTEIYLNRGGTGSERV